MAEFEDESEFYEYDSIDDAGDWAVWEPDLESPLPDEPAIPFDELLGKIAHEEEMPTPAELYAMNDLSRDDAHALELQWSTLSEKKRRELVGELVQLAEIDFRLQLGRVLRIALGDDSPEIRRMAIEGLWEDREHDLIGAYTNILRTEESIEVRAAAAGALGPFILAGELEELDSSLAMRAEESLLSVLSNDEEPFEVQSQALESIAYSGEVGVRQLIEDAYYSPLEEMRVSALNAMGRSADVRWRGLARAELENPSTVMRMSAAIACGELEARAAVEDIINLLTDEEQIVRMASVFALGRLGGKRAREALREVANSEYELESDAAEEALEELLFYDSLDDIPLLDESQESDDEWSNDLDDDPWDSRYGRDDEDLGSYG